MDAKERLKRKASALVHESSTYCKTSHMCWLISMSFIISVYCYQLKMLSNLITWGRG